MLKLKQHLFRLFFFFFQKMTSCALHYDVIYHPLPINYSIWRCGGLTALYNKDPVLVKNNWKAGRITAKYMETNPPITKSPLQWIDLWWSQRTIYPAVMNILSSRFQQSVKTTYLSRNHSLRYSGFDKDVHCTIVLLNLCFSVPARLPYLEVLNFW